MAIVLPHGVLFHGNEEEKIRTKLLERGQIDAVIGLPAGIFTNTGIPTIVMILRKTGKHHNVLFIDASNEFRKDKNTNVLRERDIKKILDAYQARQNQAGYSHVASLDEIRENGYNLNIPRYVSPVTQGQSQSIEAHLKGGLPNEDIARFDDFWQAFDGLHAQLFTSLRPNFSRLLVEKEAILQTIYDNPSYQAFTQNLSQQIHAWQHAFAQQLLADRPLDEESSEHCFNQAERQLFDIFHKSSFTDAYEAYQTLIDTWHEQIEPDVPALADNSRVTQDSSLQALIDDNAFYKARVLVPNMVIKGKAEVQDGVQGLLFSKDFIAQAFFGNKLAQLETIKQSISDLEERQNERLATASDTALASYLNDKEKLDDKAYKAIAQDLKILSADDDGYELLSETLTDSQQLKQLKAQLKSLEPQLEQQVLAQYEQLELSQIRQLLAQKWFGALEQSLTQIIHSYAKSVALELKLIDERYSETLEEITQKRKAAEHTFWEMASQLVEVK